MNPYSSEPLKNNIHFFLLIIFFLLPFYPITIKAEGVISYNSGLYFYSYEQDKENRTSLHIPISKIKGIANNFSLSFDFKIREGNHNFGYIFRLLGEKGTTLDLVISELKETKKLS